MFSCRRRDDVTMADVYRRHVSKGSLPYGYMRIQLEFEEDEPSVGEITAPGFKHLLIMAFQSLYGELGSTDQIDVLKYCEETLEAVIRIPHRYFSKLWTSLTLCGNYYDRNCAFRVLQVSGHLMGLAANSREFDFEVEEEEMDER